MSLTISSVLPAYNEQDNLDNCVSAISSVLEVTTEITSWEIIVVNDGSSDNTSGVLSVLSGNDSRVQEVRHQTNKGYGEALRSGIAASSYDWIFITDSDLQFYPEELSKLLPFYTEFDFIQGYRIKRADPLSRVVIGKIYRTIVHFFFRMPVKDPECSFRLIKRKLLQGLNINCKGPMVPVELVFRAHLNGAKFKEIGVRHREREHGETNALTLKSFGRLIVDFAKLLRLITLHRNPK